MGEYKKSSIEFRIIGHWKRILNFLAIVCSYLRKIIRRFRGVPCILTMDRIYFSKEGNETTDGSNWLWYFYIKTAICYCLGVFVHITAPLLHPRPPDNNLTNRWSWGLTMVFKTSNPCYQGVQRRHIFLGILDILLENVH